MISACMTVSVRELRTAVREWACCMFGKCSKISYTFTLFLQMKCLLRLGIHKMFIRIGSREEPDQSLIWVCAVCLGLFWQATSV